MKKCFVLVLGVLFFALLAPAAIWAEAVTQSFSHKLAGGAVSESWEHRIDLPDNLSQQGFSFFRRTLALDGKLEIEREELTATYYYLKVHLAKSFWGSKGNVKIQLEAAKDLPPCNPVSAPTDLKIPSNSEPVCPNFSWKGIGKYSAVTLYDVTANQTVWERIIPTASTFSMQEGRLAVDHHFKWAVKQSDECARYSPETQAGFRLEIQIVTCRPCMGRGWVNCTSCNGSGHIVTTGPNGQPIYTTCSWCAGTGHKRCTNCNGSGRVRAPVLVVE